MIITDDLKAKMRAAVINLDNELMAETTLPVYQDLNAFFTDRLKVLYSNFLKFNSVSYSHIGSAIYEIALVALLKNSVSGIEQAAREFEHKDKLRNSCWINVGAMGQITEIQAKIERIMNTIEDTSGKDTITDAWMDLYNYCKFAIVCIRQGIIGSIYMQDKIQLKEK